MSLADLVTSGRTKGRPRKQMLCGEGGIGKSSLAAWYPNPIFIRTEEGDVTRRHTDGTEEDIAALPLCKTWKDLLDQMTMLITEEHEYQTVVFDAVDGIERLIFSRIVELDPKDTIVEACGGFQKAYDVAVEKYWYRFCNAWDVMIKKGLNVVPISHIHTRVVKDPSGEDFTRYEPRIHKHAEQYLHEQCDEVLMCLHDRKVKIGDGKKNNPKDNKVKLSTRKIVTCPDSGYARAKRRLDLPEEIPFDRDNLDGIVKMLLNK